MDESWLSGLFNPMTPGWGAGGAMGASYPQITPTMMYPFTSVGGNMTSENAPWLAPPNFPTMSETNAEGQPLDATGKPIPSVSGGALPTSPPSLAYAQNQAMGANTANPNDRLLATLRGVQAPQAPTPQRVGTPHAPQPKHIQGGQLVNLLASLGIGPRDVYQVPRVQLPRIG